MPASGHDDVHSSGGGQRCPPCGVFVYGTLKRGGLRSRLWPLPPTAVVPGRLKGCQLIDLGPYPGLIEGGAVVLGELWLFDPPQLVETLLCLDQVEGCLPHQHPPLYERRWCSIELADRSLLPAWSYWWLGEPGRPIPCWTEWLGEPCAGWPDGLSQPPSRLTDDSRDSDL
jgi:gamma-glutamylcyclotransferase (GGCT)/AIG2-like uncharacterized protein YtfP